MSDYDEEDLEYLSLYEYEDYYDIDLDIMSPPQNPDPEYFPVQCLSVDEVEKLLNELVEELCTAIHVTPSKSKVLLYENKWTVQEVLLKYVEDADKLFVTSRIKTLQFVSTNTKKDSFVCPVCMVPVDEDLKVTSLACGHCYCDNCWRNHFESKIKQGVSTELSCMALGCELLVPEEIVLSIVDNPILRKQYQHFALCEYIKSHPLLRFCPGVNCNVVIKSKESVAKRAICTQCKTSFCFKCGNDYHSPTNCATIKKWITKLANYSETENYIISNTKYCPNCNICIEKIGGCNSVTCLNCKCCFCWTCLIDLNVHSQTTYVCEENPHYGSGSSQLREPLNESLFYYECWENHSRRLKLEKQILHKINEGMNSKLMTDKDTWIDWQYLLDLITSLIDCRYTLLYTYPHAYYMENGSKKELFRYQQALLETEIENISWKIEKEDIETINRCDFENQMSIAKKTRATVLQDFL